MVSPLLVLPALGSMASLVSAACTTGQATSWNPPPTDVKTPSSPWSCHNVTAFQESQTFAEVENKFEVTKYELLSWNCFLDEKDGVVEPGTDVCVDASLE